MFVKPWSKDAERILHQISNYGRGYCINNTKLPQKFGCKYPDLIKNNFMDIATTRHNKKQKKTWFITPPDVIVKPTRFRGSFGFKFSRFKIL